MSKEDDRDMVRPIIKDQKKFELKTEKGLAVILKLTLTETAEGNLLWSIGSLHTGARGRLVQQPGTRETCADAEMVPHYFSEIMMQLRRDTKKYLKK